MSTSPSTRVDETYDDEQTRKQIGPWEENELPDLDEFDSDTNFVVTAAAGSGKTTALVARMVALVRKGVPVSDLTAITFTRKAAGEMSTRFFDELRQARDVLEEGTEERERVERALESVQSAFIGTIHSFCSRLLRERPLAAGLPPDFSAGLEDREERELRERAWQQHLQQMNEERPELIEQMTGYGIDPQGLTSFFHRLCSHPELTPYTEGAPETPPDLDPVLALAQERLEEWNQRRPDELTDGKDSAMKTFDKAERMLRYREMNTPAEKAEFLDLFADLNSEDRPVTQKCWKGETVDNSDWSKSLLEDLLPSFVEEHIQPPLREWEAFVHQAVVDFTEPAIETYRRLRQEDGLITFHDLLSHTRDLLRDNPEIREEIQERHPILLVDEFQDTDPLQAEILSFLASQDPSEDNWEACSPRDGSLFIVGDDKQSIYRFRRADKGVFEDFRERIDAEPNGRAVLLTKNFRSREPICEWCNDAFGAIFDQPKYQDIQADYVPFKPQRSSGPDGTALRRFSLESVDYNKGDLIAEQDATRIARFIRAARAGESEAEFHQDVDGAVFEDEVDFSDFLILTRQKKRLGIYAKTLAEYGIPYTVTGSEDLGDTDELKTVVDLLRCAMRPDDPVAAVAYLKGDLSGWSDEDLYWFERAGGRFDRMTDQVPEEVLGDLEEERASRCEKSFDRLRSAQKILHDTRPGVGVDQMAEELGLLAGAAHPDHHAEASFRAGAVLRIINYVQHLAAQGLGWGEVLEELDLVLDGEESIDGMTLETGSGGAVQVMNVHQAKGLEAPVVFLADPYTSGSSPKTKRHLRRDEEQIVAPVVEGEGYYETVTHAPVGWYEDTEQAFQKEEERHDEAQERRLLYVAATRAERLLVVSTYPEKPEDGYWSSLYEHLDEADVPELEVPDEEPPAPSTRPAPDLDRVQDERDGRIDKQSQPNYRITPVTEGESGSAPLSEKDGYGSDFGDALHVLLEQHVRYRPDPPQYSLDDLQRVLESEGADGTEEEARRLQSMLERFQESWIWDELQEATEVHTEHEFAHVTAGAGEDERSPEDICRGTIDLLYRHEDAWTIIDFKSNRIGSEIEDVGSALEESHPYREQIRAYVTAWTDLSNGPVEKAGPWFADAGTFVTVDREGAET
ncbi:UvrD-helicase domain-containing protein [Salinibacter ruber]|uniref:UvrD-helicase domain-containing protein n=1 Tax=Salinibacter ruber TaxID=146919 RepID=UPI00216A6AE0|nr:UvrD-helicase domain-containing protein [Salinibacter ruber]